MRDGSSPESKICLENENAAVEGLNAKVEEECGAEEVKRTRSEVWANICPPDVFFGDVCIDEGRNSRAS
jgi:hypothetical protein